MKNKNITQKIKMWALLVVALLCAYSSNSYAQCPPIEVPDYDIDLTALPNGVSSGSYRLGGECCTQAGNKSCLYFDITVGTAFTGIAMCFDPPCSIDGYWGGDPNNVNDQGWTCPGGTFTEATTYIVPGSSPTYSIGQPIDLCHETVCIPPGFSTFRILVCKPGVANNPLEVDIIGVPKLNLAVNDISVGCTTEFATNGAVTAICGNGSSPPYLYPLPVTWTSDPASGINYLSCTNCTNPVFNYTGPAIDCSGAGFSQFSYTVTIPATACEPAQSITRIAKVYPAIGGDVTVNRNCPGGIPVMTFLANPLCSDLTYKWYLSTAPATTLGEAEVFNPPTSTGLTYCVEVSRPGTLLCTPLVICKQAWCCDAQTGDNCW
jgi:hypothetical protein